MASPLKLDHLPEHIQYLVCKEVGFIVYYPRRRLFQANKSPFRSMNRLPKRFYPCYVSASHYVLAPSRSYIEL